MQYKVPQNIDQEDKILGPLTFVQFIYVLVGGAMVILAFALFDFTLFLLVAIPIIILTVCFSLVKIQDQPFSRFFIAFLIYLRQPKRRMWHDAQDALEAQAAVEAATQQRITQAAAAAKPLSASRKLDNMRTPQQTAPIDAAAATPVNAKPARKVPITVNQGGR